MSIFRKSHFPTCQLIVALAVFFGAFGASAQFSIFDSGKAKRKRGNKPTVITADSMDFDISKNIAVFTGNVQVDDEDMKIFCHQMIIRFEKEGGDKKTDPKDIHSMTLKINGEKGKSKTKGSTKVKDITCLKDVIIIRKLYDPKEKERGEQKALAQKAHYDVKTGKITLSGNPSLARATDTLTGDVIYFYRDSERVTVRGGKRGSKLKLRSNSFKNQQEKKSGTK